MWNQVVSAEQLLGTAARGLSLAAAPTFAVMALLNGVLGGGIPDVLCSAGQGAAPLSGMALMYLLMSAFHLAPWLNLISSGRSAAARREYPPLRMHAPLP